MRLVDNDNFYFNSNTVVSHQEYVTMLLQTLTALCHYCIFAANEEEDGVVSSIVLEDLLWKENILSNIWQTIPTKVC